MATPRVKLPKTAAVGEVIEIKTLMQHEMETGLRKGADGNLIPQNIIHTFTASFNGAEVFRAKLEPGISANPYLAFDFKATESGEFAFVWEDDAGETYSTSNSLTVA